MASEPTDSRGWVRLWLTCLAFYYPIFWFSQFALNALPALLRVALFGRRLEYLELSFFWAVATSAPSHLSGELQVIAPRTHHSILLENVFVVLAISALLAIFGRRHRALTGLAVAMLGQGALWRWPFFRRQIGLDALLADVFFIAVMSLGLRWILAGATGLGYWRRVGTLWAGFVLPLAARIVLFSLLQDFGFRVQALWLLAPSAAASLLVSLAPPRRGLPEPPRTGWRSAGLGVATTLLLVAAVSLGGRALTRALERARLAANRAAVASLPEIPSNLPYPKLFFQKGVNFTAEFPDVYASENARRRLEGLPQYGVNAVALVPYGFASAKLPRVRVGGGTDSWESDEGLEELSRVAHARGLKVLLKPGMWVAGGYGGDLKFSSAQDHAQWFAEYQVFLEHYARLAKQIHADLFSVGGEFSNLTPYDVEWRRLIARTRQLYPGPLVYAANFGAEFESITFWDALDYIGLQEYYPLPDDLATDSIVQKVEAVEQKFQRPVIFTEAGFASHAAPHRQPWDDSPAKPLPGDQARCYEAVFRAFYHKPWFLGVYWWKVGTNGFGGLEDDSHTPWGKPAMNVVKRWYLEAGR